VIALEATPSVRSKWNAESRLLSLRAWASLPALVRRATPPASSQRSLFAPIERDSGFALRAAE
jgi:hypothetical protein